MEQIAAILVEAGILAAVGLVAWLGRSTIGRIDDRLTGTNRKIDDLRSHIDDQFEQNHKEHREAFERIAKIEGKLDG